LSTDVTGVNPAGDAGDTSPPIFWLGDVSAWEYTPNIITYFRIYSRPILVVLVQ